MQNPSWMSAVHNDAYLKWKMDQMLHSAAAVSASLSSKMEQFDFFFNPLRINKGKKAEY